MRKKSCSTRRRKTPLIIWVSRNCPRSKSCKPSTPSCWRKRRKPTLSTGAPARKFGNFWRPRPTWIGCCTGMRSRKKNRKKTMASGKPVMVISVHRTRSRRMEFCVQRGLGALPSTSRAEGKITAGFFPLRAECINTGIACQSC